MADENARSGGHTPAAPRTHVLDIEAPHRRRFLTDWAALTAFLATADAAQAADAAGTAAAGASSQTTARSTPPSGRAQSKLGFEGISVSTDHQVHVPKGYRATVLAAWGEPVGIAGAMPAWQPDASQGAAEQALQMGMHHDGMAFFPLPSDSTPTSTSSSSTSTRGLLAINHEYTDEALLHAGGALPVTAAKNLKSQAAHGLSVIEVQKGASPAWEMVRPSPFARRITLQTPFRIAGPAAGHPWMQTQADPQGLTVLGTLNNCAASATPWGTYLSGEENWSMYFSGGDAQKPEHQRWDLADKGYYPWAQTDERFDLKRHPHEAHRFGWIVELDPYDPQSRPVKRTAMGRAAHEGAWVAVTRDRRAVVYSGEDARFEFIYKFVSRDRIAPGGAKANADLLDHGTLYVARFDAGGRGRWLPLVHGHGPLTARHGFADQAQVLIHARQASDALKATPMDRPEWLAIDPKTRWVYCTLTNNRDRGSPGHPDTDPANPRARNTMGHIIRWREDGDFDGLEFDWNHFVLAGDPAQSRPEARGNIRGDLFACPDGLGFGPGGLLWIQTDVSGSAIGKGEMSALGNNQMLACDPETGEVRRFLTGPKGCEITGQSFTPDGRTLFVNIQHPGEGPSDGATRSGLPPAWPDGLPGGRPRSATLAITRDDGGVIGMV